MAKEVKRVLKDPPNNNIRYPWETWANGKVWECVKGKDFTCQLQNFRRQARGWAESHGFVFRTETEFTHPKESYATPYERRVGLGGDIVYIQMVRNSR